MAGPETERVDERGSWRLFLFFLFGRTLDRGCVFWDLGDFRTLAFDLQSMCHFYSSFSFSPSTAFDRIWKRNYIVHFLHKEEWCHRKGEPCCPGNFPIAFCSGMNSCSEYHPCSKNTSETMSILGLSTFKEPLFS